MSFKHGRGHWFKDLWQLGDAALSYDDEITRFDNYLGHALPEDVDDAGHLIVVSRAD